MAAPSSRIALIFCACALAWALAVDAAPARAGQPRRVFVVHSYNPEYIWTHNLNQGLIEALKDLEVVYEYHYMDAKRRPSPEWLKKTAAEAMKKIRAFNPDVVVTVDDAAQEYLAEPFLKGAARPQVIFCGVNADPAKYGFPAENVSGVRETWHFRDGFKLLKRVAPATRKVLFLIDSSESGRYVLDDLHQELARHGAFAVELAAAVAVTTFAQWREVIARDPEGYDAVAMGLYQSILDEVTGRSMDSAELARWTRETTGKPTLGFTDVAMEHQMLCGVLESAHEQGFLAGEMAARVLLNGMKAGELPMRVNEKGVIMLNLGEAERLGLEIPFDLIEAAGVVVR